MSQESIQDTQMPESHVLSSGPEESTFSELVRARKDQQHRIRKALDEQKRSLRTRLGAMEATNGNGGDALDASLTKRRSMSSAAKSPRQEKQKKRQLALQFVSVDDFVSFLTEMNELIHCAQEADMVVLHALQDRVDSQSRELRHSMVELEAQVIAAQRAASPLSHDASSLQYVVGEVVSVQQAVSEANARAAASEEALEQMKSALGFLENDFNALEMKVVDISSAQLALRCEMDRMKERDVASARCAQEKEEEEEEEKENGKAQYCSPQTPSITPLVDVALETALSNAMNAESTAEEAKSMSSALHARVNNIEAELRQMISSVIDTVATLPAKAVSPEIEVQEVQIKEEKEEAVSDKGLAEVRERVTQIEANLAKLTEFVRAMEKQPSAPSHSHKDKDEQRDMHSQRPCATASAAPCAPTAVRMSATHVDALARQVDEAAAALERLPQADLRRAPDRIARLEERVAALEERPRRGFSIRAASPSATHPPSMWSPAPYAPPALAAPRSAAAKPVAVEGAAATARAIAFGPFRSPPVALDTENAARAVSAVRERRHQKEAAATKVIAALRQVQRRLEDLSAREWRSCDGAREHPQQQKNAKSAAVLESIARRKETVHSKEQQLVELRNALWREIAQLEEDEREMLAS